MSGLTLADGVAGILLLVLTAYAVLAGADFGGGVWDLFASGPREKAQRTAIAAAMGPVWEANHVWLIFLLVGLFTAFPTVFAALSIALYLPFTIALLGIILRGAAFTFQTHGYEAAGELAPWGAAFGAASDVTPKFVSPSDPAAQWTGAMRGPAFFAYADNYLVDVKFGVIVDVEASRAIRQAEVGAAKTMLDRTQERFGIKPDRLAADTAYGSAATLDWLVNEKKIAPHIPVIDKSRRDDGSLSRDDFAFDKDRNVYVCPQGKLLHTTGTIHDGETILYRARTYDCGPCPLKPKCCPKAPERKIPRSIYEDARNAARALAGTEAFEQSRRDRKRVEMLFAHLKRILRLGRLRLRGPRGAQDEFLLGAIAQNLRRLAKLMARPPPMPVACVA